MSCKSCLYAANTSDQTIAAAGVVNFGTVVRRFGQNCQLSGGNVQLSGSGYYDLDVNLTITGSATGTTTFTVYKDGTAVPGATATVTTAAATQYTINIPAVIREACSCESVITVVLSGTTATVDNAAVVVKKV